MTSTACRRSAARACPSAATVQDGLHVNDDHFLIEIVDPVTGEVLPDGEKGEVVFTTLTKRALPLLRYNTHDICQHHTRAAAPAAAR